MSPSPRRGGGARARPRDDSDRSAADVGGALPLVEFPNEGLMASFASCFDSRESEAGGAATDVDIKMQGGDECCRRGVFQRSSVSPPALLLKFCIWVVRGPGGG